MVRVFPEQDFKTVGEGVDLRVQTGDVQRGLGWNRGAGRHDSVKRGAGRL